MFDEMQIAGLVEPSYTQTSGSVRVVLSSATVTDILDGTLSGMPEHWSS